VPYTGVIDHIKIGSVQYSDCPVRVVTSSTLAGANGLIGLDLFRDHLIHIDYPDQSVTLSPLPVVPLAAPGNESSLATPTDKSWSQIYVDGSNILVPTLINKQGPYLFVLDTGAVRTVLSPDAISHTLGKSSDATIALRGISGPVVKVIPKEGGGERDRADIYSYDGSVLKVSRRSSSHSSASLALSSSTLPPFRSTSRRKSTSRAPRSPDSSASMSSAASSSTSTTAMD
jgi:hypothetical protein